MKKSIVFLFCIVFLSAIVLAQNKMSIETIKEKYSGNENITLKVSLYDAGNNPINDDVLISINDSENRESIQKTISSNKLVDIDLGKNAPFGYWKILAVYKDKNTGELIEGKGLIFIEANEIAEFELDGDKLIITNIGNILYSKTIQILIGETIGTKKIEDLPVGEKLTLRLSAPDGSYNVRITDGKTTISRERVALTGDVVGILDERLEKSGAGITSGQGSIFRTSFAYIFVLVIFATAILLAIERNYRKKLGKIK